MGARVWMARAAFVCLALCGSQAVLLAAPAAHATPWLGVGISDGLRGVRVDEVISDTPADDIGLVAGDEITAVEGTRVATYAGLQAAISGHHVGDEVVLTVWRSGSIMRLVATLGPRLGASEILYRRLFGKPAPHFDAPTVWGADSGRLSHVRGRVVIIEFFASACTECAVMHDRLSRLVDERGRDGLVVLAASREPRAVLEAWARHRAPSFTVIQDLYGEIFRAYRIDQVPAVVVINRDGDVCYAGIGSKDILDQAVFAAERALRKKRLFSTR